MAYLLGLDGDAIAGKPRFHKDLHFKCGRLARDEAGPSNEKLLAD
jgi:hypothetical protein